jgi:hypothetical protein
MPIPGNPQLYFPVSSQVEQKSCGLRAGKGLTRPSRGCHSVSREHHNRPHEPGACVAARLMRFGIGPGHPTRSPPLVAGHSPGRPHLAGVALPVGARSGSAGWRCRPGVRTPSSALGSPVPQGRIVTLEEMASPPTITALKAPSVAVTICVAGVDYPPTIPTVKTAEFWSCSPEFLQRQVGTGRLPVEPLRLGNRLRWPTLAVAQAVGLPAEVRTSPLDGGTARCVEAINPPRAS